MAEHQLHRAFKNTNRRPPKTTKTPMGFLENLSKGFVRSAVNQVGRDVEKLIYTKVFEYKSNSNSTLEVGPYQISSPKWYLLSGKSGSFIVREHDNETGFAL